MSTRTRPIFALAVCALTLLIPARAEDAPAGSYKLDLSHASLIFKVDHLGMSYYTARFTRFDATLQFDPKKISQAQLEASVDVSSIETDFPASLKVDFNKELQSPAWLDAVNHPRMTYKSTRILTTDRQNFRIVGELTFRGVTKPVTLLARFNGGYAGQPQDPAARIGFSAAGALKRSDFGMSVGIPPKGSRMGVGDEVTILIEAEFTGPHQARATP